MNIKKDMLLANDVIDLYLDDDYRLNLITKMKDKGMFCHFIGKIEFTDFTITRTINEISFVKYDEINRIDNNNNSFVNYDEISRIVNYDKIDSLIANFINDNDVFITLYTNKPIGTKIKIFDTMYKICTSSSKTINPSKRKEKIYTIIDVSYDKKNRKIVYNIKDTDDFCFLITEEHIKKVLEYGEEIE